jgi:hypothetical protein
VIFRWISVARYWPVQSLTLGTGALETTMLIVAIALWLGQRHAL